MRQTHRIFQTIRTLMTVPLTAAASLTTQFLQISNIIKYRNLLLDRFTHYLESFCLYYSLCS